MILSHNNIQQKDSPMGTFLYEEVFKCSSCQDPLSHVQKRPNLSQSHMGHSNEVYMDVRRIALVWKMMMNLHAIEM